MALEYFDSDLTINGKLVVYSVPNSTGTLLTYNPTTKEVGTRTNAEIISDLALNTSLTGYVKKTGDTMSGALTFGNGTAWMVKKDMSTVTSPAGFARDMFQLIDSTGIKDVMGWKGTVDATGTITVFDYGYIGGTGYNVTNAIRYNSAMQVSIGGNVVPSGNYTLEVSGNTLVKGTVNFYGTLNTSSGELLMQRFGVTRFRTNTNSVIISGDTSAGIVYLRPQGDTSNTAQVMFQGNNTTQYTDNYNLLFGTQTSVGSALFHTNNNLASFGYGIWLGHNLQFNGTDFIQPRGTLRSLGFTSNYHKGFSFNIAEANGTNGAVVTLTEVAKVSNTGTITTLNDGNSTQWNSAYNASLNAVTLNTAQTVIATKTFSVLQKMTAGVKYFDNNTANTYLRKYENIGISAQALTTLTANVKITFPVPMAGVMWTIKVKVVQYDSGTTNNNSVQVPMTINISGYSSSAGATNRSFGASGDTFHTNFAGIRIGYDTVNLNKIVWLDFNTQLSYPKVIIEEVIVHHSSATSTTLDGAYTIDLTTDETNYTNQTTILKENFKELSDLGSFFRIYGNGAGRHNTSGADVFTLRNTSFYALGANRPLNNNSAIVNFTPYSSGGSNYGFSLGARNNKLLFVTEENSVFGNWNELYHSGNFSPTNYYTKTEAGNLFVGLNGVQTIADTKTFSSSPIVPNATLNAHAVNLGQMDTAINSVVADYIPMTMMGSPNGVASLGSAGIVPSAQLPASYERTLLEYTGNFGEKLAQAIANASEGDTINAMNTPFDVGASYVINNPINVSKPLIIKLPVGIINYMGTSGNIFNINASNVRFYGTGRSSREDLRINTTDLRYVNSNGGYHFYARGQNVITINGMDITGIRTTNYDAQQDSVTKPLDGSGGIYIEKSNPGTTGSGNTISNIVLENLLIVGTKVHGIYLDTPILGSIKDVRVSQGGGHGIFINGGTSVRIENCYVSSTHKAGFMLYGHSYSTMIACASEFGGMGYWLRGCFNVSLISCGAESNGNRSANVPNTNVTTTDSSGNTVVISDVGSDNVALFRGSSYVVTGGQGIVLFNCASTNAGRPTGAGSTVNSRDILVRDNARNVTIISPRTSVGSGNTFYGRFNISFEGFNGGYPKAELIYNPTTSGSVTPGVAGQYISSINDANNQAPVFIDPGADVLVRSENKIFTPITTNLITSAEGFAGNAKSATKLENARTISVSGAVSGSGSFDGSANLNIPTTIAVATSMDNGVIKVASDTAVSGTTTVAGEIAGRIYGVQKNASGQAVVTVPWTDTTFTLSQANTTTLGGVKMVTTTTQTVAPESLSTTAKRTYAIQFNSSGQLVVNVPWTDTTYTAGTGLTLTGTSFSVNYGTSAGTSAQGNDSRINNGQTAFGWGDHALAGYALNSQLANYMPTTHPANSINNQSINSWNNTALNAIKLNQEFSINTANGVVIADDYGGLGGGSGLFDVAENKAIAMKEGGYYKYGATAQYSGGIVIDYASARIGYGGVMPSPSYNHYFNGTVRIAGGISLETSTSNDVIGGDGSLYLLDKEIQRSDGSLRVFPFDRVMTATTNTLTIPNLIAKLTLMNGGSVTLGEMFKYQEVTIKNMSNVDAYFYVTGTSTNVTIPPNSSAVFYMNGLAQIELVRMDLNNTQIVG